jgi:hypothetical protein
MWSLDSLREDVERLFGREQVNLLEPSLNSIPIRQDYAKVHYQRGHALLKPYLDKVESVTDAFHLVLGYQDGERVPFEIARNEAAANYVACLLTVHGFADCFAHVVYFAYGMNLNEKLRLREREVTAPRVVEKLDAGPVRQMLADISGAGEGPHLAALANLSKHRVIIGAQYGADVEPKPGTTWHGLRFPVVTYSGNSFAAVWADEFLRGEFSRQTKIIDDLGQSMNSELRTRAVHAP